MTPQMTTNDIEIIQVNISGDDKPGLTTCLTDILARYVVGNYIFVEAC